MFSSLVPEKTSIKDWCFSFQKRKKDWCFIGGLVLHLSSLFWTRWAGRARLQNCSGDPSPGLIYRPKAYQSHVYSCSTTSTEFGAREAALKHGLVGSSGGPNPRAVEYRWFAEDISRLNVILKQTEEDSLRSESTRLCPILEQLDHTPTSCELWFILLTVFSFVVLFTYL